MSKTKTPFFGLGSQGSIGGSITTQKHRSATLVRSKPIPTDPYSLGQAYQRWLYEDYVYLWHQASQATRDTYRTAGSRYHLTAFQYWMRYHLRNLPDILGWWKLDNLTGGLTLDSSKQAQVSTVIGATQAPGNIGTSLFFDGVNDRVHIPTFPTLETPNLFSVELWLYPLEAQSAVRDLSVLSCLNSFVLIYSSSLADYMGALLIFTDAGVKDSDGPVTIPANTWSHLLGVYDGTYLRFYLNGIEQTNRNIGSRTIDQPANPIYINSYNLGQFTNCRQDNVILYNRALDATEAFRHSQRRYPL